MGSSTSTAKTAKYGAKTTSDQIMRDMGQRASGKHVIITGANCGLGFETSRSLVKNGAKVTIACRSKKLGDEAIAAIKKEIPGADVSLMILDLASFDSIRSFVAKYKATGNPLHLLINNAAVMSMPKTMTSDGLEMQFGVNHVGHFILTTELLDVIKRSGTPAEPARVINLSSVGNWVMAPKCGIRFDDLNGERHYNSADRYGSAKLANILFTKELHQRCAAEGANVVTVSVHPGIIAGTKLARHTGFSEAMDSLGQMLSRRGAFNHIVFGELKKNIKQGTSTTLFCALTPDLVPGEHYSDNHVDKVFLHEMVSDPTAPKRLWETTEQIVKQHTK